MPIVVNLREAKARLSQLLEQAHAGQEVILTQQGRPVARLIALHATAMARQTGGLAGHVAADFRPQSL